MDGTNASGRQDSDWPQVLDRLAQRWRDQVPERRQGRSRRREQEILQAALRVFSREGVARARIADVAAEAGMPLSSLYEYFPSKEAIAYSVPVAFMARFFVEYAERALDAADARGRLRLFLWLSADFARRNPDWARVLYLEVWPSVLVAESAVRETVDDYGRFVIELIRRGENEGAWAPGPSPYETATILIGAHNQLVITWLLYRRPRDVMRAMGSLVDRLLLATLPAPGPAAESPPRRTARVPRVRGAAVPPRPG